MSEDGVFLDDMKKIVCDYQLLSKVSIGICTRNILNPLDLSRVIILM